MKTRVKRRRVKRTRVKRRKTRCRYKMRRNLKGGWGFSLGGKLEEEEQQSQYGGWGEQAALV